MTATLSRRPNHPYKVWCIYCLLAVKHSSCKLRNLVSNRLLRVDCLSILASSISVKQTGLKVRHFQELAHSILIPQKEFVLCRFRVELEDQIRFGCQEQVDVAAHGLR